MLCETWLSDVNKDLFILDGYSFVEKHRENAKGGGVAIYVKNNIQFKIRKDLSENKAGVFESIFIELLGGHKSKASTVLGEVYRPPASNPKHFCEIYEELLSKIANYRSNVIIGADQNLDLLRAKEHLDTSNFIDINFSSGIAPTISRPTRVTHRTATLIDNIYASYSNFSAFKSKVVTTDISDHFPILLINNLPKPIPQCTSLKFTKRNITQATLDNMKDVLGGKDWTFMGNLSVEDCFDTLNSTVVKILDDLAPEKEVCIPAKHIIREPWMSKGLIKSSRKKIKLYRKSINCHRNHPASLKYRLYRNAYNKLKHTVKREYYQQELNKYKNDVRKTWILYRKLIGKLQDKTAVTDHFLVNGEHSNDSKIISEGFNDFFVNAGISLARNMPVMKGQYKEYLKDSNTKNIFLSPTTHDEIKKIINELKTSKSSGHDGITTNLIKEIGKSLVEPLTLAINKSIATGVVPDCMKIAKVVPVFKRGDPSNFTNYRPIAILPALSKVLEKVIHKRLYNFLLSQNLLYKSQYGFRKGHSTNQAIIELVSKITQSLDERKFTLGLFLDLSKAFDTINHSILINKLQYYGIRGHALDWF